MLAMNQELFQKYMAAEDKVVLVEFWAPWCSYCRRIAPALEKVAQQYADTLTVGQVNIDEESALASTAQINVIPTLILYRGGKALGSLVAPESKAKIEEFIQQMLGF